MTPEQILEHPAQVLEQRQREAFFEKGYLLLESFLPSDLLAGLRQAYSELIDRYRNVDESNDDVLIEADHSPLDPRFKRINRTTDQHPEIWRYAADSVLTEAVSAGRPVISLRPARVLPNAAYEHALSRLMHARLLASLPIAELDEVNINEVIDTLEPIAESMPARLARQLEALI